MSIVQHRIAWLSTETAVQWMKFTTHEGEVRLTRVDPYGLLLEVLADDGQWRSFGITSDSLAPIGRYLMAVALAQGQDVNEGWQTLPGEVSET